jgi:hypothetical protein
VGNVAWFSLHGGETARADERQKFERLCRDINRTAADEYVSLADKWEGLLPELK